jgi:uncharacterized protein (DUF488 family)
MTRVLTLGAYGWTPVEFFDSLERQGIDVFLDVRQRRGMRGSRYAFANAGALTAELAARNIDYRHLKELAPDPEIRGLQLAADAQTNTAKAARKRLAPAFVAAFTHRKLEPFDWNGLVRDLAPYSAAVLFCVERTPDACHRSLVAEQLARRLDTDVMNLTP